MNGYGNRDVPSRKTKSFRNACECGNYEFIVFARANILNGHLNIPGSFLVLPFFLPLNVRSIYEEKKGKKAYILG